MVIPEPRFTLRNPLRADPRVPQQLAEDIIGHHYKKYLPLLGSCFLFILFMNLLGSSGFLPRRRR